MGLDLCFRVWDLLFKGIGFKGLGLSFFVWGFRRLGF